MTTTWRRLAALVLGAAFLSLPAHEASRADQVHGPIVSPGAVATPGGSLLNAGQSAIGIARSTSHTMKAGGIPAIVQLSAGPPAGDVDGDGDADLDDYAIFAACMNGPDVSLPPRACTEEHFDRADVQADEDVDFRDYAELFGALTAR